MVEEVKEAPRELKFKNSWQDWALRTVVFLVFMFFGAGKFKTAPDAPWVVLFNQVGFGQWFRYFTGIAEMLGAFLVLISLTVEIGLIVLACVTFGALLIVFLVLHQPADAFFPFAFLSALIAFWMHRRRV